MFDLDNVGVASEEDLNLIMGGKTPAKDKESQQNKNHKEKSGDEPDTKKKVTVSSKKDLENAFSLPDEEDETDDEEKKKKDKSGKDADDDDDVNDEDEEDTDDENNDDNDENVNDEDNDNDENENEPDAEEIERFLKSRVDFLIKHGAWKDFDGREEVKWDEETFGEYELQQQALKQEELKEDLLDQFGPYGRQIAEYSQNGGDPEKLIDVFKEQARVDTWDIKTEDGQKQLVYKYQTEVLKRSADRAKKYIDSLIADKELEAEATDIQATLKKNLDDEIKEIQQKQKLDAENFEKQQDAKLTKFSSDVTSALANRKDISEEEKDTLKKVLTVFKKAPGGQKINGFAEKFVEFRKNLDNYIDLVRLVVNPKGFKKAAATERSNKNADKTFQLVRTSAYTRQAHSKNKTKTGTSKGTKFKLM